MPVGQAGHNNHHLKTLYDEIAPNWVARQKVLRTLYNARKRAKWNKNADVCVKWRDDSIAFLRHVVTLENWDDPDYFLCLIDKRIPFQPGNLIFLTSTFCRYHERGRN